MATARAQALDSTEAAARPKARSAARAVGLRLGMRKGMRVGTKNGKRDGAQEKARLAEQAAQEQAAQEQAAQEVTDPHCSTADEMSHGYCLKKYGGWDGVPGSIPTP